MEHRDIDWLIHEIFDIVNHAFGNLVPKTTRKLNNYKKSHLN